MQSGKCMLKPALARQNYVGSRRQRCSLLAVLILWRLLRHADVAQQAKHACRRGQLPAEHWGGVGAWAVGGVGGAFWEAAGAAWEAWLLGEEVGRTAGPRSLGARGAHAEYWQSCALSTTAGRECGTHPKRSPLPSLMKCLQSRSTCGMEKKPASGHAHGRGQPTSGAEQLCLQASLAHGCLTVCPASYTALWPSCLAHLHLVLQPVQAQRAQRCLLSAGPGSLSLLLRLQKGGGLVLPQHIAAGAGWGWRWDNWSGDRWLRGKDHMACMPARCLEFAHY